jgi:hypothetical protein
MRTRKSGGHLESEFDSGLRDPRRVISKVTATRSDRMWPDGVDQRLIVAGM